MRRASSRWLQPWLQDPRAAELLRAASRALRKADNRGSNRVLSSNGHSCAEWRRFASAPKPRGRLGDVLAPIADPDRLAEIGDWLVRCDTGAEFLARLGPSSPS